MKYGFVRVAAAVPAVKVADCKFNAQQIETQIAIADGKGVQIIIFPELSITGYTCADLFGQTLLLEEAEIALMQIMNNTRQMDIISIIGMPVVMNSTLLNCAVVCQKGKILGIVPKTYLPNYKEFYEQRHIPLSVFHFDCFWMKGFEWCNFTWDKDMFPDPAGMLERFHKRGLKICVWINPYIAQKSPLFGEAMEKGYLLMKDNGRVWQWDMWQAGMGLVDFTNPDACSWYQSKLKALLDVGVDCFKTDFGERVPTNVKWFDGSDPEKMHNYYTYLYNQCVFELLKKEKGESEAVLFARSAAPGGQKFPVHWGGDSTSQYISMAETLRGGLSLMDSGFGFWSHDIGGFEDDGSADLYKRWVAFGLLSSHSRLHGSSSYRVPWNYDEEACEVLKYFTELKWKLMPYIYSLAQTAHEKGLPVMRPMHMQYPKDRNCAYLDQQYMLGDRILVAPVFSSDGKQDFYLPEGNWVHLLTKEPAQGNQWHTGTFDYFSLPLYVREGDPLLKVI